MTEIVSSKQKKYRGVPILSSKSSEIEVTLEIIARALECNDYHESYYFPKGSVKVESIEKI